MNVKKLFETLNPNLEYIPSLTIKAIKQYRGHDGMPLLQANLYIDGKKTAFIGDDSHGGEFDVRPSVRGLRYQELHDSLTKLINDRKFVVDSKYTNGEVRHVMYTEYLSQLLSTFDLLMGANRVRKTKTHIFNPKTFALSTVNAPVEQLDAWLKENLEENEIVVSALL